MPQLQTTGQKTGTLAHLLQNNRQRLEALLPAHMKQNVRRIMASVMVCAQHDPKLLECDPASVLGCVLTLARQGLTPGPQRAQAYLIPFRDNRRGRMVCTLVHDYRGLLELAFRSGRVKDIDCNVVYQGDLDHGVFEWMLGSEKYLHFRPAPPGKRGSEMVYVYAVLTTINGGSHIVVMDKDEVEKVKASARGSSRPDSPWVQWPDRQWRKTAIKRVLNEAPQSDEVMQAIHEDNLLEIGTPKVHKLDIIDDLAESTESASAAHSGQDDQLVKPVAEEKPKARKTTKKAPAKDKPRASKKKLGSTKEQWRDIAMHFNRLGLDEDFRHRYLELFFGSESSKDLSIDQAAEFLEKLSRVAVGQELVHEVQEREYELRGDAAVGNGSESNLFGGEGEDHA